MKILLASPIDQQTIEVLRSRHDIIDATNCEDRELERRIVDCEVLVFRSGVSITGRLLAAAPELKLLIRAGSGLDNIDLENLQRRQLPLLRIPEPGAQAVAELAFGLMLALSRQILVADRLLRQGRWAKHQLTGFLLAQKTLGVVGMGNIGSLLGRMGAAWKMQVKGCVEHPSAERAVNFLKDGLHLVSFEEVLLSADYLCICVPLKTSTNSLIGERELALLKPTAFLLNMARGGIVDEIALSNALRRNRLAGAALDVHQKEGENRISPLADLPNVVLTPHIGAMTVDSQREIGRRIIEIVDNFPVQQNIHAVPGQ
ncbi:NAD(P)-dependent oxidoreductase [Desulfuromonas sp. CSMB_57]|uniref:NAD(P)-dependent oxidoreductase n=1 Tax=Desulfuromonas sp. CSMB_57 TaxID=2807629 RepID=UPI001CD79C46|nr:NAD(P)-dependent oxidoreductase [Desulfuromonas sp. CSMB_57]